MRLTADSAEVMRSYVVALARRRTVVRNQHKSIQLLEAEVREIERRLRIMKNVLRKLLKIGEPPVGQSKYPYYGKSPKDAALQHLRSVGRPLSRSALHRALVDGGITIGKKRAEHNVRIGLDLNIANGNLVEIDGMIGLPEWVEGGKWKRREWLRISS